MNCLVMSYWSVCSRKIKMGERDTDELIMISALQHYSYCARQCALIHQEQVFDENEFTLRGQRAHRRVDSGEITEENGLRIVRSLPLYSTRYGLTGKADVVEFLEDGTPYPVEYKQGRRQKKSHDDIQLAAQALCLEEMTGRVVPEGAIYHHKTRRRRVLKITAVLKQQVVETTNKIRSLVLSEKLPPPVTDKTLCRACSLKEACQPEIVAADQRIKSMKQALFHIGEESG